MQNPFDPGYYVTDELRQFGFARVGEGVRIAKNCVIIGLSNIEIGENVRIDAFCSLIGTGPLRIGGNVHVAGFCHLLARGGLTLEDFTGISHRVTIYTANDDYSGRRMTNPTVPAEFTGCHVAPVTVGKHSIIGSGSTILPGCDIGVGTAVGAMSLVIRSLPEWSVYAGTPAVKIGERSRDLLRLEAAMRGIAEAA